MKEPTEIRTLNFTRGAGRSEWYSAKTILGATYIINRNGDRWEYLRPGCGSTRFNRPYSGTLQGAIEECQKHINGQIQQIVFGAVESKKPKAPL